MLNLPSFSKINIRSGIDMYGFSSILANKCKIKSAPRSFANWIHGWTWTDSINADLLGCSKHPLNVPIIVRNLKEKNVLNEFGFKNVVVGGLPFAYIESQHQNKLSDSLLAIPPHSSASTKLTSDQKNYLYYLFSLKHMFDDIYICIYYLDLNGPMHTAALQMGFKILHGANPYDNNSLLRTRAIFDSFKYVTSNVMGSHILYALYSGCNFSFSGPIYSYSKEYFFGESNPHKFSDKYIEEALWTYSEAFIKNRFKIYINNNPKNGLQDIDYAKKEIGYYNLLNEDEIIEILGWDIKGQFLGYANGGLSRILRYIQDL